MEPADIDWKSLEWRFARDELYEHFRAPKWVDLSSPPNEDGGGDDEAWFCRPDCRHPKTAEDFLLLQKPRTPPSHDRSHKAAMLVRSASCAEAPMPLGERNTGSHLSTDQRDGKLKRRGVLLPSSSTVSSPLSGSPRSKKPAAFSKKKGGEDRENQDPNLRSPVPARTVPKAAKEAVKSSADRPRKEEEPAEATAQQRTRLKSTLSARNLFAGKDVLSQISEFCSEIKRLATARKQKADAPAWGENGSKKKAGEAPSEKPVREKSPAATHCRRKSTDAEKPAIPSKGGGGGGGVLQMLQQEVRSCPPTPQRFPSPLNRSKQHHPLHHHHHQQRKASPRKPFKPVAPERGVLKELMLRISDEVKEAPPPVAPVEGEEERVAEFERSEVKQLDMFWFFKPCAYLGR